MAKKKEKKDAEIKQVKYRSELIGLLLLLIAIIGLGDFGPIGNVISGFAIFIGGSWYHVILIYVFCIGIYMVVHREGPDFFAGRLVGLYILFFAILIFSHLNYVKVDFKASIVVKDTVNQLLLAFKDTYHQVDAGGGMIGCLLAIALVKLFADGAIVIVFALLIFGFIMLFNISLSEGVKWLIIKTKKIISFFKKDKEVLDSKEDKVIISSLDELTNIRNDEIEEETIVKEDIKEDFKDDNKYLLPPMSLLNHPRLDRSNDSQGMVRSNIEILERVFDDFGVGGKVVEVQIGPSVSQYEVELKAGTKVNRLLSLKVEIALALAAKDIRIQPIAGKKTIGIEIPNKKSTIVLLKEVLSSISNVHHHKLLVGLGKDIMGKSIYAELNKMPHLLVSGATGSGKSVCINSIIISLLMYFKPDEVKLLLIDPKKVELNFYNGIPHLLTPVVTDPRKASVALMKIVGEMESRYDLFDQVGAKNIVNYNQYVNKENKHLMGEEKLIRLPYIIVIIDELADLMLTSAKEVEDSIMRITQMARAAGIHLIVATQRPSTDIITGLIKSNIPSRISFAVSSNVDSRTILDMGGAEKLLGKGDMLFLPMGENVPIRLQGSFVSETEIKKVVDFTIKQQKAKYDEKLLKLEDKITSPNQKGVDDEDPLYDEIVEFAIKKGKLSASLIQRRYRLGYNRAARIIDLLEERGIVGPPNGPKAREVLIKLEENEDN